MYTQRLYSYVDTCLHHVHFFCKTSEIQGEFRNWNELKELIISDRKRQEENSKTIADNKFADPEINSANARNRNTPVLNKNLSPSILRDAAATVEGSK